jgi:uncharacterized paraquat-inducible protein A
MQKKYRIVEKDNFKYTLECKVCHGKFRVPRNHGKIVAKCPKCQTRHSVDTDNQNSSNLNISPDFFKNLFFEYGRLNVKLAYAALFILCIVYAMLRSIF